MRQRVVIIGGGVAGLTAAHELVDRDFDVHVYERRPYFGGKAASVRRADPATAPADPDDADAPADCRGALSQHGSGLPDQRAGQPHGNKIPGEHGFRFYPGWYRHLPDTMRRIPYLGRRTMYEGANVLDNLVAADAEELSWYDRERIEVLAHPPRNLGQAVAAVTVADRFSRLGLATGEIAFFFGKLIEFLTTPESKRIERYDAITWWDYLDAENKSQAFRDLIDATTRTMVAAKARQASAYTIASLAVRTLFDVFGTVDRVLNGPTNETWIDPWIAYLKGRGVTFHPGQELDSITFDPDQKAIERLGFTSILEQAVDRIRWTLALVESWWGMLQSPAVTSPATVLRRDARDICDEVKMVRELAEVVKAWPPGREDPAPPTLQAWQALMGEGGLGPSLVTAATALAGDQREAAARALEPFLPGGERRATLEEALARAVDFDPSPVESGTKTAYVFALPLEQMAYYVNRAPMMTQYDPSLRRIVLLSESTDWMAGIQFFLTEEVDFAPGHLVCMDSEWSLTAIEETQFWRDVDLPEGVRTIISVDVAAWDRKGRFNQKEAFNCTDREIAAEVWAQLKHSLNRDRSVLRLRDEMLRGKRPDDPRSFYLDSNLIDLLDRKKQGSYEKARSVRFSAPELMRRQQENGHESATPYVWGRRLRFNVEPLLVNRVGTQALRPDARTAIPNMFLASDYVRTNTDLACMEGANEAARRAVNAVLEATSSSRRPCDVWSFSPTADLMERLHAFVQVRERLTAAAGVGRRVADTLTGRAGRFAGELLLRLRGHND
jgi:uncharacterized protein with NAD-binding domain and iron-sulfur cluster